MRHRTSAFTLIELSIVLVVVGLIIGGILVGMDLIKSAAVRATVGQVEKFDAAAHAFRIKYNCMPGDCANATDFGLGVTGGPGDNGNGDGIFYMHNEWYPDNAPANMIGKSVNFWYHLTQAGLIEGSYSGFDPAVTGVARPNEPLGYLPNIKAGSNGYIYIVSLKQSAGTGGGAYTGDEFGLAYYLSHPTINGLSFSYPPGTYQYVPAFTPAEAYGIDRKIDDGNPSSGRVQLGSAYSKPNYANPACNTCHCTVHADAYDYDLSVTEYTCLLVIRPSF